MNAQNPEKCGMRTQTIKRFQTDFALMALMISNRFCVKEAGPQCRFCFMTNYLARARLIILAGLLFFVSLLFHVQAATLTNCDQESLQAALNQGGTITFDCSGSIL